MLKPVSCILQGSAMTVLGEVDSSIIALLGITLNVVYIEFWKLL